MLGFDLDRESGYAKRERKILGFELDMRERRKGWD